MNHTMNSSDTHAKSIRFLLNGIAQTVGNIEPTTTVLGWLRANGYIGTKEGCAEGDCGACTVILAELVDGEPGFKSINACIQFMPMLDGKGLFTVEALRQNDGSLHPVQQAMVDCHGSQCGFCTPGFVMSLWSVYLDNTAPCRNHDESQCKRSCDERKIANALSGNLCRCTGYKPIIAAGQKMFEYPRVEFDNAALAQSLKPLLREAAFSYVHESGRFDAPQSVAEFAQLHADFPRAIVLAGGTDIGLWVTKQMRQLPHLIYVGEIAAMKTINLAEGMLAIGAGASLNAAYSAICQHYPAMQEMWERFASTPIRNAGTLGGNVANGSPIGDSMPALIALGAKVELQSMRGGRLNTRILPLEDFYIAYQKKAWDPDEVLTKILLPLPQPNHIFRTYKVAKRFDSDISAVCGAYALKLDGGKISACKIDYGGMAATSKRATQTEAALHGKEWNEATVHAGMQAMQIDYQPLSDMRSSAAYRLKVAQNLLYRFYLETRLQQPLAAHQVSVFEYVSELAGD